MKTITKRMGMDIINSTSFEYAKVDTDGILMVTYDKDSPVKCCPYYRDSNGVYYPLTSDYLIKLVIKDSENKNGCGKYD